jgi:UDP-3-O-[3-hydroxymyristoyl] glucosamine N-acyltransferase
MKLSDLNIKKIEVIDDGEFLSLGLLSHHYDKLLVGFYDINYLERLIKNDKISCVVTNKELKKQIPSDKYGIIVSENPLKSFYDIHAYLENETTFYGASFPTKIGQNSIIHERAYVDEKNVIVGDNCVIEANATILSGVEIGNNVVIRAGAVIGSQGFEFKKFEDKLFHVKHTGGVKVGNDVEIQSNTVVDRSVFGHYTEIGDLTKIDSLVRVGHNVKIGINCRLAAASMIGGSTTIGNNVWIGPNSTISSEIIIHDNAKISLGAVVTRDVKENQKVSGNFAIDHHKLISFIKQIR